MANVIIKTDSQKNTRSESCRAKWTLKKQLQNSENAREKSQDTPMK